MDCQFDSQEAFTRAFKGLFNMTPAQYRKAQDPFRLLYKDQFSPNDLHYLHNLVTMEPEIILQPATKLIGIASEYDNEALSLHKLWGAFGPNRDRIPNRQGIISSVFMNPMKSTLQQRTHLMMLLSALCMSVLHR